MSSLFPEPVASEPLEVYPFDLDTAIRTFLNRWIPRVLSAENRPTIEAELRALIQDAKEPQ